MLAVAHSIDGGVVCQGRAYPLVNASRGVGRKGDEAPSGREVQVVPEGVDHTPAVLAPRDVAPAPYASNDAIFFVIVFLNTLNVLDSTNDL